MKLQNIVYPSPKNCQEEQMYFRRSGDVAYILADDAVTLNKGGTLFFDTYFNGFSASKWFKYTDIDNVFLKVKVNGKMFITLTYLEKMADEIYTTIVEEVHVDTEGKDKEIKVKYNTEKRQGMFAFKIFALQEESKFYGGEYYTELNNLSPAKVKIGMVICTFNRQEFVYKNMEMLTEAFLEGGTDELKDNLRIYISDNGRNLDESKIKSPNIKVFPNKNAGGAGGFTRGLIECMNDKKEKITHALLMDDDIVMQPESIYRTYALLSLIKNEYKESYIGGAMLRIDRQWFQTEAGGLWQGGSLLSRKCGLDLRTVDACLFNEFEEKCDYNAWWYCTIPMEFVREDNLPMPIFIRGDDVEYGLRNMKQLILMNGICVWHEPFEFKFSSMMYYYIFRNRLIDNSIHHQGYSKKAFWKEFIRWFFTELFLYRYKNAELLLEGTNDFLKGVDWLKEQDGEALNKEIMGKGYRLQDVSELEMPFDYGAYERTLRSVESKKKQRLRKLLLNGIFLKAQGDVIVPTVAPHMAYFYRKARVLHYDYSSKKGFVSKKDNAEFRRLYKELRKLKKLVDKNYDRVVDEYALRANELMRLEFWNNYLEL